MASYIITLAPAPTTTPAPTATSANRHVLHQPGIPSIFLHPNRLRVYTSLPSCSMQRTPNTTSARTTSKFSPANQDGTKEAFVKAFTSVLSLPHSIVTKDDTTCPTATILSSKRPSKNLIPLSPINPANHASTQPKEAQVDLA